MSNQTGPHLPLSWPLWAQYALSLGTVGCALTARWLLDPIFGEQLAFGILAPVLLLLVVLVRPGPFLIGAIAGWAAALLIFVRPRLAFGVETMADAMEVAVLGLAALAAAVTAWLSGRAQHRQRQAERALGRSEERYRAIVESQTEMVCRFRTDGTILFVNAAYARARGTAPESLVGEGFWSFIAAEDRAAVRDLLDGLRPEAPEVVIENRFDFAGETRWTLWTNRGLAFDEQGRATEVQSSGIDITARKKAEEALAEKEAELEIISAITPLVLTRCTRDLRYKYVNRAAAALFGAEPEEIIGKRIEEVMSPEMYAQLLPRFERVLRGERVEFEEEFGYPGAGRRWMHVIYSPEADESGEVLGWIASIVDVTQRRRAEEALRESEQRLRAMFDQAAVGIAVAGLDGRLVEVNQKFADILGYAPEYLVGRDPTDLTHPEDRPASEQQMRRLLEGQGDSYVLEKRYLRRDSSEVWSRTTVTTVRDADGRIRRLLGVIQDITARRRAEESLALRARQRAALYEFTDRLHRARSLEEVQDAALESILSALSRDRASILLFDDEGVMRFVGWRGLSAEYRRAVEGHSPWRPGDAGAAPITLEDVASADLPAQLRAVIEGEGIRALGFVPLMLGDRVIGKFMIYYDAPHAFERDELDLALAIARQLAFGLERTRAEEALRESEERLRLALRGAGAGAWTLDLLTGRIAWGDELLPLYGYDASTPRTYERWIASIHPDDRARVEAEFLARLDSRLTEYQQEFRVLHPVRGERWILDLGRIERDPNGTPIRCGGISIDITDRRRAEDELRLHREHLQHLVHERTAELEESHRRLRLSERMASLGTLSAGLGHDMGNILVPMRVWIDLLQQMSLPNDAAVHLRSLHQSTEYLRSLASGLRSLSLDFEDELASPHRTNLAEWWREVHGLCRASLPKGIVLHAPPMDGLPAVRMPAHALTQVVFNLVQNAGNVMRDRGWGGIWIECQRSDDGVTLTVRDDGPGMTPEVRERCMEPFFTTSTRGRGTGLGLSIVYNALRRYGGSVEIESRPGRGAAFTLRLPLAAEAAAQRRVGVVSVTDPRSRAVVRVLLSGMGIEVDHTVAGPTPQADLWVVDQSVTESDVLQFLHANGGSRRVVRLGRGPEVDSRVETVLELKPSALRAALDRAMGAATEER